jgi:hypothetical protein
MDFMQNVLMKVKSSLCSFKHHGIETCGGVEVRLPSFLSLPLDGMSSQLHYPYIQLCINMARFMYMPATNYNIKYFISAVSDKSVNSPQMLNNKYTIQTKERVNCKAVMEENVTIISDLSAECF